MTDELRKLLDKGLGDFRLAGASWSNDGEDLVLALQEPGGTSSSRIMLRLVWATNVTIRMDFAEYVGMPLLVESRFESLARERWLVEFTFGAAPDGFLRCECNEIAIISGEAAAEPPC